MECALNTRAVFLFKVDFCSDGAEKRAQFCYLTQDLCLLLSVAPCTCVRPFCSEDPVKRRPRRWLPLTVPALMCCCVFVLSAAGSPVKGGGEDGWEALNEAACSASAQMAQFFGNRTPFHAAALDLSGPRC